MNFIQSILDRVTEQDINMVSVDQQRENLITFFDERDLEVDINTVFPASILDDGILSKPELLSVLGAAFNATTAEDRDIITDTRTLTGVMSVAHENGVTDPEVIAGLVAFEAHFQSVIEGAKQALMHGTNPSNKADNTISDEPKESIFDGIDLPDPGVITEFKGGPS